MIQIGGTDYIQPTDMSIVAYSGSKYILVSVGDKIERVLMSEVLESSGVTAYPHAAGWDLPYNFRMNFDGYIHIGPSYRVNPYVQIMGASKQFYVEADVVTLYAPVQCQVKGDNTAAGYTFVIQNAAGAPTRRALADTWAIYASFAADKDNLAPVFDPVEKVRGVRGYSYRSGGVKQVGFTVDDIEASQPDALERDARGEITGYDLKALLATAYEAIRLQDDRLTDLEAQVTRLKTQVSNEGG